MSLKDIGEQKMVKNKSLDRGIAEVENATDLEQLKEGILSVFKEMDIEISYLWSEIEGLNSR